MKQDKLNDALQSVQDFMDKSPNFTNAKNRAKAKDLQQHLLRAAESQVAYLRGLLEKVRIIREFEQEQDMRRNKNNRGMLMKLLYFQVRDKKLLRKIVYRPRLFLYGSALLRNPSLGWEWEPVLWMS